MDQKLLYWIEISDYDLETARAMLDKRRFLYVGFMCHQSIEKVMKAYWQFKKKTHPPKTHNLAFLFEHTGRMRNYRTSRSNSLTNLTL